MVPTMSVEAKEMLRLIGNQLDEGKYPVVMNSGVIMPSNAAFQSETLGTEKRNGKSRQSRRSKTRQRKGTTRRKRAAIRSGAPNKAPQVICSDLLSAYKSQVNDIDIAYPGAKYWWQQEGFWLLTNSALMNGSPKKAVFISAIPFSARLKPQCWGFWDGIEWIGPRHTNFPNGSVCSFQPFDRTWHPGDSLITLLDLHTLWALRHLHLEIFNRWPGRQSVSLVYERILEFHEDEYCGCDATPSKLYRDCCLKKDQSRNKIEEAIKFALMPGGSVRKPPDDIYNFMCGSTYLPSILSVCDLKLISI